jgi:hypothetical protein
MKFDTRAETFESWELPLLSPNEHETRYALNVHPITGDVLLTSNMSDRIFRFTPSTKTFVETGSFSGIGYGLLVPLGRLPPSSVEEAAVATTAAVEWKIAIEGTDAFGEVRRHEIRVEKSWDRLFDGEVGLSVDDGKKVMAVLQTAVVNQEADTYTLFRRICRDCGCFGRSRIARLAASGPSSKRRRFAIPAGCCVGTATRPSPSLSRLCRRSVQTERRLN